MIKLPLILLSEAQSLYENLKTPGISRLGGEVRNNVSGALGPNYQNPHCIGTISNAKELVVFLRNHERSGHGLARDVDGPISSKTRCYARRKFAGSGMYHAVI